VDVRPGDTVEQDLVELPASVAVCQSDDTVPDPALIPVRMVNIDESAAGEVRSERQSKQSALADVRHFEGRPRLGIQPAVADNADASRSLGDEDPAIGGKVDRPRDLEIPYDGLDLNLGLPLGPPSAAGQQDACNDDHHQREPRALPHEHLRKAIFPIDR